MGRKMLKIIQLAGLLQSVTCSTLQVGREKPVCAPLTVPQSEPLKDAMNAFVVGEVVPDLLPRFSPVATMRLLYHPNPFGTVFFPGQRVPESLTKEQPVMRIRPVPNQPLSPLLSPHLEYTLIVVDPDVPSRINATSGAFLNMLATRVKLVPNAPYFDLSFPADIVSPYSPPSPAEATGFHRYTFLLYHGLPNPQFMANNFFHSSSRFRFNLRSFVADAGLCDPIAAIFMFTENSNDEADLL